MEQAPVIVSVIILLSVGGLAWRIWPKTSIQTKVNQFLDLASVEMPRLMIRKYLIDFGFLISSVNGERLCFDRKFGPRIASEESVARLIARAAREKIFSAEVLAQEIVRHFTQKPRFSFFSRWYFQSRDISAFTAYVISNLDGRENITLRHEIEKAVDLEIDRHLSSKISATEKKLEESRTQLLEQNLALALQIFRGQKRESTKPANPAAADSSAFNP